MGRFQPPDSGQSPTITQPDKEFLVKQETVQSQPTMARHNCCTVATARQMIGVFQNIVSIHLIT